MTIETYTAWANEIEAAKTEDELYSLYFANEPVPIEVHELFNKKSKQINDKD